MNADLIIFASPTYFNMPSAAMVNLLDRTNNLYEFFANSSKKAMIYLVGKMDEESIGDAAKCIETYCQIMNLEIVATQKHVKKMQDDAVLDCEKILESL